MDLDAVMTQDYRGGQALLAPSTVGAYLATRGIGNGTPSSATLLTGGVSSVVMRVALPDHDVVVKQALARLAVKDEWWANPSRSSTEATALRYLRTIGLTTVPEVLDADCNRHVVTITAAPRDWGTLKDSLMQGRVPATTLAQLGQFLAACHERSSMDLSTGAFPAELDDPEPFKALRLDPYFHVTASRVPELAVTIEEVSADVAARRRCLTLGDFSPKNILVSPDGSKALVIDLEVANLGDPAFDVAFFCSHLLLKWVRLPEHRPALLKGLDAFFEGYAAGIGVDDPDHLSRVTACLLLARVWGSSPVEYLDADQKSMVHRGAERLLTVPSTAPARWTEIFT